MPPIELVTLDCADTLLKVKWIPHEFATDCVAKLGIEVDVPVAQSLYRRLLGSRWAEYQRRHVECDTETCRNWWRELTIDWLDQLQIPVARTEEVVQTADKMLYTKSGPYFHLFDDVLPTLDGLKEQGIKLAVVSNWDYSLHRILEVWELTPYFDFVVASLEFGVEKPEPAIFLHALQNMGVEPGSAIHVGDNPLDDVHGAQQVGMQARLIDRSLPVRDGHRLSSLTQLLDDLN